MTYIEILKKYNLDVNTPSKQVRIENRIKKYVVFIDGKYFLISQDGKIEINYIEKTRNIKTEKKVKTKTNKNTKSKKSKKKTKKK